MTPEAKFSKWIIHTLLTMCDVTRVENSISSGMPDINACINGVEFWIETKIMDPKCRTLLRPYQYAWIMRRSVAMGRVFVISETRMGDVHVWHGRNLFVQIHGDHLCIISPPSIKGKKTDMDIFRILALK